MGSHKVIDLYSGGGGASLGFKLAGCDVVGAVDFDYVACEVYGKNLGLQPIKKDLRKLAYREILEYCGLSKSVPEIIAGCPPCQAFSSLRRTRSNTPAEPKDELLVCFVRLVREALPQMVVFENVPGIVSLEKGRYLNYYLEKMGGLGYGTVYSVVNAADYGVPQFRKRVVAFSVLGVESDELVMPRTTHTSPEDARSNRKEPWVTVRDSISDLRPLEQGQEDPDVPNHRARTHGNQVMRIIKNIPKDGGSRRDLPKELWLPCHKRLVGRGAETVYGRMRWNRPSSTITTRCTTPSSGRFLHPEQNRGITPREAARLQTFPDTFIFPEEFSAAEKVIGNAVPSHLFHVLVEGFFEENKVAL